MTPAPPGWYSDPSGGNPGALRWWDGARWTEHVHVVQPAIQQPYGYPPYAPQGVVATLADPATGARVGGSTARLSLVLALAGAAAFVVFEVLSGPTFAAVLLAAPAIILSVRALRLRVRYRPRRIATPVVALSVAGVTLLACLVWPIGGMVPHIGTPGAAQHWTVYPHNAELTKMGMDEFTIERAIRANGSPGGWTTNVSVDPQQNVYVDGAMVATIGQGETLSYQVTTGGQDFVLAIYGRAPGEYIYYDYATHTIKSFCAKTDTTCAAPY